jgi:polyisoprenoid-binding protein YceI
MKHLLTATLLAATTTLALSQAKPAQLLPAQSELVFTSKQMGVPVDGSFKRFDAQLTFDPKKPETGKVAFTIDLASVSLGAPELEGELAKAPWFDSRKIPQASFQSSTVKATGPGKFEVAGKLTIKGQTRDIVVPITLAQAGPVSTASGGFVLKRLEFKIGDGEWADTSMVANDVQVKFKLAFNGIAPL